MNRRSLKISKKALAVGMSFVLVATMSTNLQITKEDGTTVRVIEEVRALPSEFKLEVFNEVKRLKPNKKTLLKGSIKK